VLHFYTGMTDDVHSPRDLPDKINSPGAVEVLDVARQVLLRIACDPQRMAFTGVKPRGQAATGPAKPFMGVALGTPPPRVKGCRIEDVNADSPADKAGLKTADVITAWDQAAVASVAEFFAKMDNAKPGQKVALTIIRDGKERTVEVTLGGR
jgi:S1-C subfamily serine protease